MPIIDIRRIGGSIIEKERSGVNIITDLGPDSKRGFFKRSEIMGYRRAFPRAAFPV